jgi:hypothetical protein
MAKQYRDEIAMVCHDMMKDAQSVGAVTDSGMREFEKDCFIEEPKTVRKEKVIDKLAVGV